VSRIALFGGVYSNHLALAETLVDARRRNVDACYCLGDLGAFGPHPDRVFALLEHAGVLTIAGNYDDSLARGLTDCQCGYTDPRDNHFARLSYEYTFRKTSNVNKSWLATLPPEIRLELDGKRVLLCHGSPRRQNEFLWESTTPDHFLEKVFDRQDADIVVATHTGIKWSRELASGRLFVNCGVIGRPGNDGTSRVWYAILETEANAPPRVEFIPVAYDWRTLAREMREEELPAEFIETIATGWWTTCLEILPVRERQRGRH